MSRVSWSSLTSLFVKEDAAPPEPSLPEPGVLVDEGGSPAFTETLREIKALFSTL